MIKNKKHTKGFSLLETLLVVAIIAVIATGATVVFNDWFRDSVDRKVGREMNNIQDAAEQFVQLNFADILSAVPNTGDIAEIDINNVIDAGFLRSNFNPQNSFLQVMRILVRNSSNVSERNSIEVITVTDDLADFDSRKRDGRLARAATAGGPKVGVISNLDLGPQCCNGNIQSLQGLWSVDINDFNAIYNVTPTIAEGGYMAAYSKINDISTANEDYLYRVRVGLENSNRMNTNLDMNDNDILSAGSLSVDNIDVLGNATINGGPSTSLETSYSFAVQDNFVMDQNMVVNSSGNNNKGDILINGDDTVDVDFILSGNMDVSRQTPSGPVRGDTIASNIETETLNAGSSASFNDAVFNSGQLNTNNILTNSASLDQSLEVNDLVASNVRNAGQVNTGILVAIDANVSGETNVDNDAFIVNRTSLNGNATVFGNVNGSVDGQAVIISEMTECATGCTGYEGN
jgi:prepilin-type N-terminal cleavage/methylation domain-containing protein